MNRHTVMRSRALASRVKRYHTWPVLHQETVGEHSHGVLRIFIEIFGPPKPVVTRYIVEHDMPELHTGDLPFPVKAKNPGLKREVDLVEDDARAELRCDEETHLIDKVDHAKVKICDLLQMWEFGRIEMRMGNLFAIDIVTDTANMAVKIAESYSMEADVTQWLAKQEL